MEWSTKGGLTRTVLSAKRRASTQDDGLAQGIRDLLVQRECHIGMLDSTSHRLEIFRKKKSRKFQKTKLGFAQVLVTIYIAFTLYLQIFVWHLHCIQHHEPSRHDFKCMGGCILVICKYYIILCKGVKYPSAAVYERVLESVPHGYWGIILYQLVNKSYIF